MDWEEVGGGIGKEGGGGGRIGREGGNEVRGRNSVQQIIRTKNSSLTTRKAAGFPK